MLEQLSQPITLELVQAAQDYREYSDMVNQLVEENRTTGSNQSENYLAYTRMAAQRMKRWDKTAKVSPDMEDLVKKLPPQIWLIITEAWCGDAAQTIPYIFKLTELNPDVEMKLILRDENLEIMDAYLTEGARSIPKLIALSPDLYQEFFTWGPRPQFLQDRLKAFKIDSQGVSSKEFAEGTHLWYARDKNQSLEKELFVAMSAAFNL